MTMYVQDHDELFPPVLGVNPGDRLIYEASWMKRLEPYVKSLSLFICPSSDFRDTNWRERGDILYNYSFVPTGRATGYDAFLLHSAFGEALMEGLGGFYAQRRIGSYTHLAPSHTLAEVARPAETVAINDHNSYDWGLTWSGFYYPEPRHIREGDVVLPNGQSYPSGLVNAVFVDGHVKALKMERLLEIRKGYTTRFGRPRDVYIHFWPYE
jgi:prepilin-type processing-associated H-X9-DG protein